MPLRPATSASHEGSRPIPTGEISPRPVTTTRRLLNGRPFRGRCRRRSAGSMVRPCPTAPGRRRSREPRAAAAPPPGSRPRLLLVGGDEVDGVLDGLDVLRLLVRDLDLELLLHL